jgi:hypothetical protein
MVVFKIGDDEKCGMIQIVDAYGTFEQEDEPSYDICVEEENCIYKQIRETAIKAIFDAFGSENIEKLMILIIL